LRLYRVATRCPEWGAWQPWIRGYGLFVGCKRQRSKKRNSGAMAAESGDAMMPRHPAPGCTSIYVPWQAKHEKNLIKI